MTAVSVLPVAGQVLLDARDGGRSLRLNWHAELGVCVLSIWRGDRCAATFQLPREAMPSLINALVEGLIAAPAVPAEPWTPTTYSQLRQRRDHAAKAALGQIARLRPRRR